MEFKKLMLQLQRELDRVQRSGGAQSHRRELEEKLEEWERELRELRRRRAVGLDGDALRGLDGVERRARRGVVKRARFARGDDGGTRETARARRVER